MKSLKARMSNFIKKTKRMIRLSLIITLLFFVVYVWKQYNIHTVADIIQLKVFYNKQSLPFVLYLFLAIFATIWILPVLCKRILKLYRKKKYLNSPISAIDKMSGEEFEILLQCHFEELGYRVEHVGQSGDYGADLILEKDKVRTIVQAKRYQDSVGVKAVQEVISARAYYDGDEMMVITNSYFTKAAKKMAEKCNVALWDRTVLKRTFHISESVS